MSTIAIVDYGMGNLRSVQKGFAQVGVAADVTRDAAAIERATGVVLPGVGAYGACMDNLREYGLVDVVRRVVERGTPFLGICLGLQLLFEESEEFGPVQGLGLLRGRCVRFRDRDDPDFRVPHMGWNQISKRQNPAPLAGVEDGTSVYFVHSYYVEPRDPALIATVTDIELRGSDIAVLTRRPARASSAISRTSRTRSGTCRRTRRSAARRPRPRPCRTAAAPAR